MPLYCSFAGWSGSGKTTLLREVIARLSGGGYRVGAVKATHHDLRLDTPGKDSHSLREAGAEAVVLSEPTRTTVFLPAERLEGDRLGRLLAGLQIVIGEGCSFTRGLRFEVASGVEELSGLRRPVEELDAVVTDSAALSEAARRRGLEVFRRNEGREIAEFIGRRYESLGR